MTANERITLQSDQYFSIFSYICVAMDLTKPFDNCLALVGVCCTVKTCRKISSRLGSARENASDVIKYL